MGLRGAGGGRAGRSVVKAEGGLNGVEDVDGDGGWNGNSAGDVLKDEELQETGVKRGSDYKPLLVRQRGRSGLGGAREGALGSGVRKLGAKRRSNGAVGLGTRVRAAPASKSADAKAMAASRAATSLNRGAAFKRASPVKRSKGRGRFPLTGRDERKRTEPQFVGGTARKGAAVGHGKVVRGVGGNAGGGAVGDGGGGGGYASLFLGSLTTRQVEQRRANGVNGVRRRWREDEADERLGSAMSEEGRLGVGVGAASVGGAVRGAGSGGVEGEGGEGPGKKRKSLSASDPVYLHTRAHTHTRALRYERTYAHMRARALATTHIQAHTHTQIRWYTNMRSHMLLPI